MIEEFVHVGMSVVSLERSIAFYRDVLEMEHVETESFGGPKYSMILGLDNASGRLAILRGGGLQLEIFEFDQPKPRPVAAARPVCEYGISHFCIRVRDIDTAYKRLLAANVAFHCPPVTFGDVGTATYARDPDGNVIELLEKSSPEGARNAASP